MKGGKVGDHTDMDDDGNRKDTIWFTLAHNIIHTMQPKTENFIGQANKQEIPTNDPIFTAWLADQPCDHI